MSVWLPPAVAAAVRDSAVDSWGVSTGCGSCPAAALGAAAGAAGGACTGKWGVLGSSSSAPPRCRVLRLFKADNSWSAAACIGAVYTHNRIDSKKQKRCVVEGVSGAMDTSTLVKTYCKGHQTVLCSEWMLHTPQDKTAAVGAQKKGHKRALPGAHYGCVFLGDHVNVLFPRSPV